MNSIIKTTVALTVLAISSIAFSCIDDDEYNEKIPNYGYFIAKFISVPQDSIQPINIATRIHVTHERLNSCDEIIEFKKLDSTKFTQNDSVVTLGIYGATYSNSTCNTVDPTSETIYNYIPTRQGKHKIRIWAGKDENNQEKFIEKTINVR